MLKGHDFVQSPTLCEAQDRPFNKEILHTFTNWTITFLLGYNSLQYSFSKTFSCIFFAKNWFLV